MAEVILVVDTPHESMDGVRFVCPPEWLARLVTRAMAKLLMMIIAGIRYRPDLYMGYHIFPSACSALVVGRIMGRPACHQVVAGPVEIIGGGMNAENALLSSLGRPSRFLERLAVLVVRQFDLVVVRGKKAREFLARQDIRDTVSIITGSVRPTPWPNSQRRPYDLGFVGRLSMIKQPWQFVEIVASASRRIPEMKSVVVGEGPLMSRLRQQAVDLGVSDNIDFVGRRTDVESILSRTKVFMLTSRSEGLSIALAEAMSAGVVPVVADVGELGDLVTNGVNGYLVKPDQIGEYVQRATSLLRDRRLWLRCSKQAAQVAREMCGMSTVADRWRQSLQEIVARASKHPRGMN